MELCHNLDCRCKWVVVYFRQCRQCIDSELDCSEGIRSHIVSIIEENLVNRVSRMVDILSGIVRRIKISKWGIECSH